MQVLCEFQGYLRVVYTQEVDIRVVFFTLVDKFTKINNAHCGCTISQAGADVSKGQQGEGRGKEQGLGVEGRGAAWPAAQINWIRKLSAKSLLEQRESKRS